MTALFVDSGHRSYYVDRVQTEKSPPAEFAFSGRATPHPFTAEGGTFLSERTHSTRSLTTRHAAGTGFQACDPIHGNWRRRKEAPRVDARTQPQHHKFFISGGAGVGVRLPENRRVTR